VVVITIKYKAPHSWADCVDRFIGVVNHTNRIHIVPVGTIVGLAHLVQKNATSGLIDSICLVNKHVELNTYCTVY